VIVPLFLVAYAIVLAVVAALLLPRAGWIRRHPQLGLAAWHTAIGSVLVSAFLASLVTAHDLFEPLTVWLLAADPGLVHAQYAGSYAVAHGWNAAILVATAVLVKLGWEFGRQVHGRKRERRLVHSAVTALVTRALPAPNHDILVIARPTATAFCLPSSDEPVIVVSEQAIQDLSPEELGAVIAHEREHLARHHGIWSTWAAAVSATFAGFWLAGEYSRQVDRLQEMAADDAAVREYGPRTVASALLQIAPVSPGVAIAMAASGTAERGWRLIKMDPNSSAVSNGLFGRCARRVGVGIALGAALPVLLAIAPGLLVAGSVNEEVTHSGHVHHSGVNTPHSR